MKKIMLGLVAAFALVSFAAPVRAEEAAPAAKTEKAPKKAKKAKKAAATAPAEGDAMPADAAKK